MGHVRTYERQFKSIPAPPRWHNKGGRKPRQARMRRETEVGEEVKEYNLKVVIKSLNWANGE